MAANPRTLRILDARFVAPATRELVIECVEGPPLASVGGKYVILNTGVVVAEKAIKRAYSLLPVAGAAHLAQLTVKRLADGPGSNALHAAAVGTELSFSGPWGKLASEPGREARPLVVATDTGITAALGVASFPKGALEVLWLRADDETFLEVDDVRRRVEASGARFVHALIPGVSSKGRAAAAWAHIDARVAELGADEVIAAGDGAIVHPLRDRLLAPTSPVRDVRIECFFHNPERKIA
jgi:ferredoxin-NADP reductase